MPLIDKMPPNFGEKQKSMNKEVILKGDQEVERIKFEDVKTSDIIGFVDGGGNKGFFAYEMELGGNFILYPVISNTKVNVSTRYQEVPKSLNKVPIARMIVFSGVTGPDGLYAWLSKQE
jgi:hypothetical protein